MRVLVVNREDAYSNFGGDTVQMEHTVFHLLQVGVDVEVGIGPQTLATMRSFDIVHLFNLQTFVFTASQLELAKQAGCKVAVSTIWWDFTVEEVLEASARWRLIRRLVGTDKARKMAQKKIESIVHHDRRFHRQILRDSDMLLPNSESEVAQLKALCEFDTPVHVVPNGVDLSPTLDVPAAKELLAEHGLVQGEFILVAARVEPVKNQLAYVRAVAKLGLPVACAGAARDGYAQECSRAGVVLLGQQERPVLQALYKLCRLHALPSFRETPGLASLEAGLAGASVVSTNIGSARDYFGDMVDYLDPHDDRSMRRATQAALDRPKTGNLGKHIGENFTWRRAAEETLRAYERI